MENEGLQVLSDMPRPEAYPCDYNDIHFLQSSFLLQMYTLDIDS